jgi:hypothetical protein
VEELGIGTAFTWETNAVHNALGTVIGGGVTNYDYTATSPLDPNLPPIVAGDVFNVQFDNQTPPVTPSPIATSTPTAAPSLQGAPTPQPILLAVVGSRLVVSTPTGQVLLSVRVYFGNNRLVNAFVTTGGDGLPDVLFVLQDKHSHKLKVVRLDGAVLLRIADQVGGRPNSTVAAVLERDGFLQVLVATDPGGHPVIDIFSGRTGDLLRHFRPFLPGIQGTVHLSMADVNRDGVLDLVVTDSKAGQAEEFIFDGRSLLAPLPRVL